MSRNSMIIAVCATAVLSLWPMELMAATTSKEESTKKSSTTTKKKKKPAEDADKKSAADDTDPAPATPAVKKKGTVKELDLPLPAKTQATGESGTSTEKKKATENGQTESKTPEKTEKIEKTEKTAAEPGATRERAPNATVEPDAIVEFPAQSARLQQMIRDAIDLTRLNLTYTFGSADPDKGGMDCSGTIYYLLHAHGFNDAPRDSSGQYLWARKSGAFYPVVSANAESEEFNQLLPGDLMFWTGTYQTGRDIPISHVMMYLGRERGSGKRVMFGASDGRSYNGVQRWGVSVFDFKMPKADTGNSDKPQAHFVGYARIPGLRSGLVAAEAVAAASTSGDTEKPAPKAASGGTSKKKGKSAKSE